MTSLIIERPELRRPENVELLVSEGINLITRNKPPGLTPSLEEGRKATKAVEQKRLDMRKKAKQQLMSEGMSEKEAEARLVALEGQQTASRYMSMVP
jgi:phosphosulfolactate synthase (CoM biosynthesis protein A)